jgi:hypothetical protein
VRWLERRLGKEVFGESVRWRLQLKLRGQKWNYFFPQPAEISTTDCR